MVFQTILSPIMSSSSGQQPPTTANNGTSAATSPSSTPLLPGQVQTADEQEDELVINIDELIRAFMTHPNRRFPYRLVLRWTSTDNPEVHYSVLMIITERHPHG